MESHPLKGILAVTPRLRTRANSTNASFKAVQKKIAESEASVGSAATGCESEGDLLPADLAATKLRLPCLPATEGKRSSTTAVSTSSDSSPESSITNATILSNIHFFSDRPALMSRILPDFVFHDFAPGHVIYVPGVAVEEIHWILKGTCGTHCLLDFIVKDAKDSTSNGMQLLTAIPVGNTDQVKSLLREGEKVEEIKVETQILGHADWFPYPWRMDQSSGVKKVKDDGGERDQAGLWPATFKYQITAETQCVTGSLPLHRLFSLFSKHDIDALRNCSVLCEFTDEFLQEEHIEHVKSMKKVAELMNAHAPSGGLNWFEVSK